MKQQARGWLGREFGLLLALFALVVGTWVFIEVTDEVLEGEYRSLDESIVLALRADEPPHTPVGPDWLEQAALDVTALGGYSVLTLAILAVSGFLLLARAYQQLIMILTVTLSGLLITHGLKLLVARPRPMEALHLTTVSTPAFPSGHAMNSAIIYLTLAAMLARMVRRRRLKLYIMTVAVLLTGAVGMTRVYLGVHYPTDVLAGWAAGIAWAAFAWLAVELFSRWRDQKPSVL
ncbi:MAG: phosphatase PAP2 family protein [Phycisphaeraceae bacterium]